MPDLRASLSRPPARNARPVWLVAAVLLLAALGFAWIDGGERALRPISAAVELPAAAGSTAP